MVTVFVLFVSSVPVPVSVTGPVSVSVSVCISAPASVLCSVCLRQRLRESTSSVSLASLKVSCPCPRLFYQIIDTTFLRLTNVSAANPVGPRIVEKKECLCVVRVP